VTRACIGVCLVAAGAFAAYGVISNLNAGVLVTMSWLTVVKQTGLTPLDPGMWPRFLGIYAGLYVAIGSVLRPLRLTAALAAAPFFNTALDKLQQMFRVNKAVAFGIILACIAVSSFTVISCMLVLAGGFPNGPPPLPWKQV
jgi:predicted lysophospholipase L1 biosynthesis ABC-type transport system permease subunit